MCEEKMKKFNEFKLKGFELGLMEHEDADKLIVAAKKGDHILRLSVESMMVAYNYVKRTNESHQDIHVG